MSGVYGSAGGVCVCVCFALPYCAMQPILFRLGSSVIIIIIIITIIKPLPCIATLMLPSLPSAARRGRARKGRGVACVRVGRFDRLSIIIIIVELPSGTEGQRKSPYQQRAREEL